MCLYTNKKTPLIADRDIKVFKHLKDFAHHYAYTPYQNMKVELDKDLVPRESTTVIDSGGEINGGAIHACLWPNFTISDECVEAFIPKGTEYWMGIDNATVCARKLHLTSKIIKQGDAVTMDNELAKLTYENAPMNDNGVKVGSFLVNNKKEIKGIVVGFNQGEPLVADILNVKEDVAFDLKYDSKLDRFFTCSNNAAKDMDGKGHMKAWKKKMKDLCSEVIARFEAYTNARVLSEKHYVPALGEMEIVWKNLPYIAAACSIVHITCPLTPGAWYWTSTEGSCNNCWCSNLHSSGPVRDWDRKDCHLSLVPFVASEDIDENE